MGFSDFLGLKKTKTVVFILGCQRSGTTMLENILDQIPEFSVYGEGNKKAMRVNAYYRFKDERTIRRLISKERKRFIVFRPLNDAQYADRHLELHQNSKAIWIYRRYPDTINSAVRKWGDHQKKIIMWIRNQAHEKLLVPWERHLPYSIYAERISQKTLTLIKGLANDDLTVEEGAALTWYIRNQIYFDLNFHHNNKVLLVKYENLVTAPEQNLKKIFKFLGFDSEKAYSDNIFSSSIGKNPVPTMNQRIENTCKAMMDRLDNTYSN